MEKHKLIVLTIAASDNILTEREFRPLKLIYIGRGGIENKADL